MLVPLLAAPPVPISVADRRIVTVGRFDRRDPQAIACQWSASEVRLQVQASTLRATIEERGHDLWEVVVDGKPMPPLALKEGVDTYTIDLGSDGTHEVRLVKRTEPFVGTTAFRGFELPEGKLLQAARKKRRLEFVGDSITCGFGNEGADQNEPFRPETENAYLSYAGIAARAVNADVTILAWSGRKMWPDNTTPEVYDRILPTQAEPTFAFRDPAPDAVVIHLATNDFSRVNPEENGWTGAYETFIRRVWGHYPKARVYVAVGSMMTDEYPKDQRALSTVRGYLTRMVDRMKDRRLRLVEFDPQRIEDGIGSSWHPSVRTHQKMADCLTAALKRDLRW